VVPKRRSAITTDLAPSLVHPFGVLKDAICGTKFENDDCDFAQLHIGCVTRTRHGTRHVLVSRWRKAVEVDGDFVTKYGVESKRHSSCVIL